MLLSSDYKYFKIETEEKIFYFKMEYDKIISVQFLGDVQYGVLLKYKDLYKYLPYINGRFTPNQLSLKEYMAIMRMSKFKKSENVEFNTILLSDWDTKSPEWMPVDKDYKTNWVLMLR